MPFELKVIDGIIHPCLCRVAITSVVPPALWEALADRGVSTDDQNNILLYSDNQLTVLTTFLETKGIKYTIAYDAQPDPALLQKLQGRVHTRTRAQAALTIGKLPDDTLEALAARLAAVEEKTGTVTVPK